MRQAHRSRVDRAVALVALTAIVFGAGTDVYAADWVRVRATWYGGPDGLLGNTTMCGQKLTTSLWGVAHGSYGCGTHLQLRRNGRIWDVPVLDRSGGGLDLMPAVKRALGCGDICVLDMRRVSGFAPAPRSRVVPGQTLPATDTR